MINFKRDPFVSLATFSPEGLAYYISPKDFLQSCGTIKQLKKNLSNCQKPSKLMIQQICRQMFLYANSAIKIRSNLNNKQRALNDVKGQDPLFKIQDTFLDNVKSIIISHGDEHGIEMHHKLSYLIFSYIQCVKGSHANFNKFLNQAYWLLQNHQRQFQQNNLILMMLNQQFEDLIEYFRAKAKQTNLKDERFGLYELLIQQLAYQIIIQNTKNKPTKKRQTPPFKQSKWFKQLIKQINTLMSQKRHNYLQQLTTGANNFEIQLCLSILLGSSQIIDMVAGGSWSIYLALYFTFMVPRQKQTDKTTQNYNEIYQNYLIRITKHYPSYKKAALITFGKQSEFLLKFITCYHSNHPADIQHSFHWLYQETFNFLPSIICQIIGTVLFEMEMVDSYSLINNKTYENDIILSLLESSSLISWNSLVHIIGFVQVILKSKGFGSQRNIWENLLYSYLPYEIYPPNKQALIASRFVQERPITNNINQQPKGSSHPRIVSRSPIAEINKIEQRIQDLNSIGLSSYTKQYLQNLFKLYVKYDQPQQCILNQVVLEIFILNVTVLDSGRHANYINNTVIKMKKFMKQYHQRHLFRFDLLEYFEDIIQRKERIIDNRLMASLEKLFSLAYKVQNIRDLSVSKEQNQNQHQELSILIQRIKAFNRLFLKSQTRKPISILSMEVLLLAKQLTEEIQNYSILQAQQLIVNTKQTKSSELENNEDIIKIFKRNVLMYYKNWMNQEPQYNSQQNLEAKNKVLSYFHKMFM